MGTPQTWARLFPSSLPCRDDISLQILYFSATYSLPTIYSIYHDLVYYINICLAGIFCTYIIIQFSPSEYIKPQSNIIISSYNSDSFSFNVVINCCKLLCGTTAPQALSWPPPLPPRPDAISFTILPR